MGTISYRDILYAMGYALKAIRIGRYGAMKHVAHRGNSRHEETGGSSQNLRFVGDTMLRALKFRQTEDSRGTRTAELMRVPTRNRWSR